MKTLDIEAGQLDLVAGGPPCQGFSKNVPRKHRRIDDPNNILVRTFLNYCETLAPKLILMENVAEMRNGFSRQFSDEISERLEKAGYLTQTVLNAAARPSKKTPGVLSGGARFEPVECPGADAYGTDGAA